ncbi:MAG TPA: efflux RND transporter permease subunit [Gammaproteobacteria bacterium]|nr:efflux RND transporter permease subunit [Gammaproteobacteria bacterium]
MSVQLGFSGSVARRFLQTEITPLLALLGLLLGMFAIAVTPREEEPQIDVTFANVFIPFPGASAREVENLVTSSAEQVLSEIEGVKHIYSMSRPGQSILTVEFNVGEERTEAIVRLYNALYSNEDWLPTNLGVGRPLVKPMGIDDVPIVTLTLWTEDMERGAAQLKHVAHTLETELKRVPGTRDIYTVGGPAPVVHVLLDAQRLAGYGLALEDLRTALRQANQSSDVGELVADNRAVLVKAGELFQHADDLAGLVVGLNEGKPVYLRDVADIHRGPEQPEQYVWFGSGVAGQADTTKGEHPAVTLAIAKQPGTNAVGIADQIVDRLDALQGIFIPEGVNVTVTRNYGVTADQKAQTLIKKLIFATASVVILVIFSLGWREAIIVGAAVVITLAITLFASWAWGFTLNRVSLFALIFSIGILVDDAVVVVENIHRHMQMGKLNLVQAIPVAVDEVGGPTILATFTVIAALLPMAFVTGLMGPYMSPIPINASLGMLISLAVALVITPWMSLKLLRAEAHAGHAESADDSRLLALFRRVLAPFLGDVKGQRRRYLMLASVLVLILLSTGLAGVKLVVLKMLPFDNKSEFQVVVDMPEGIALEQTNRMLTELADYLAAVPEVANYQIYAGTAAPINFNGLVRQYYLRSGPNVGDIQVNLVDKSQRERKSHDIARSVREPLVAIGKRFNAVVKVVEVPPGPPVLSPLVAEIYGPDYEGQIELARRVKQVFHQTADIVDIDDSVEAPAERWIVSIDRSLAAQLGVDQATVVNALATALDGEDVSYLRNARARYPIAVRMELPVAEKADLERVLTLRVRGNDGALVALSELVTLELSTIENAIYRKDHLPLVFVTGDMAGELDSPLYGMADLYAAIEDDIAVNGEAVDQHLIEQPANPYRYSLKWDGEWQITYETFRDMGIAYSVGLILIYLLVVAQFRSYLVPLVIMAPIPLTIIGVMPGHALLGAQFTATSMIGMIALAGIIVRNSILLVDFINEEVRSGVAFEEAVIRAGAIRAKPIILTGLAAILGALFILDDPIFRGLAIALIFGLLVSTVLTLVVIPVLYYALMRSRMDKLLSTD